MPTTNQEEGERISDEDVAAVKKEVKEVKESKTTEEDKEETSNIKQETALAGKSEEEEEDDRMGALADAASKAKPNGVCIVCSFGGSRCVGPDAFVSLCLSMKVTSHDRLLCHEAIHSSQHYLLHALNNSHLFITSLHLCTHTHIHIDSADTVRPKKKPRREEEEANEGLAAARALLASKLPSGNSNNNNGTESTTTSLSNYEKCSIFPQKLMQLLKSNEDPNAIWWLDDGESFALEPEQFTKVRL